MDSIILLNPSDIISESMNKINHNFEVISASEDVTSYKIDQFTKQYKADLAELKELYNSKDLEILDNINNLNDKITAIPSLDNLQDAINQAITGTADTLEEFIRKTAGAQVETKLGDYATTTTVDGISSAFEIYTADADKKMASVSTIVGNSKFYTDESGHFMYGKSASDMNPLYTAFQDAVAGASSPYTSLEEIFDAFKVYGEEDVLGEGDSDDSDYVVSFEDPKVVAKLIAICEKTFKTMATEMAVMRQTISDGVAAADIVAAVKGNTLNDENDIVAAIFVEANRRDGSAIALTADKIKLDADHKLELNTGEFTINSNNFRVDENGSVTATDLVLNTSNGNTTIDKNGILHANGAEITGDIKASKFEAVNVDGDLIRTSIMNGQSFNIVADGTVTDGGTTIPVSGNALYISIEKEIANQEGSNIEGEKLYGVPVLCMRYNGVDYVLSPASWISKSVSADTSNMRWIPRYSILDYSLYNLSRSYSNSMGSVISTGNGNGGTYYIFKNASDCIRNTESTYGVSQLQILDLGNFDLETNRSWFTDLATDRTSVETINSTAACTTNVPAKYVGEGIGTRTEISSEVCTEFNEFLKTVITGGVVYQFKHTYTSLEDDVYGISNLYSFIENVCGLGDGSEGQSYWKLKNIESESAYNIVKIDNASQLRTLLPFGGATITNKSFNLTLDYYPQIEITNKGKSLRNSVNCIWVKCDVVIQSSGYQNESIDYTIADKHTGPGHQGDSGTFNIGNMTLNLSFNFILDFQNAITGFNPLDTTTKSKIDTKIDEFLTNCQFDIIPNGDNYMSFEAVINDGNNSRLIIDSFEQYKEDN